MSSNRSAKPTNAHSFNTTTKWSLGIPCPRHMWSIPDWRIRTTLIDYYSRLAEVEITTTTTSARILKWLGFVFATHGYPVTLQTDNAKYFTSAEFRDTLTAWGINKPRTATEYWPQANGLVERFNKILLKFIQTSLAEGRNWKESIPNMLQNYRATPHRTIGKHRRNSSHIRKFYPLNPSTSSTGDCHDDEDLEESNNSTPTLHSPEDDPEALPAPSPPLLTDPPLRRSTRHRKPPDFFQHT